LKNPAASCRECARCCGSTPPGTGPGAFPNKPRQPSVALFRLKPATWPRSRWPPSFGINAGNHRNTQARARRPSEWLDVTPSQSDDGSGLGSCNFISFSQHTGMLSAAFVHSTSVPHSSQRYRLPSWLTFVLPPLFLQLHGLAAAMQGPFPCTRYDKLSVALLAHIPLSHVIRHVVFRLLSENLKISLFTG
jgi:hypothetical protein